MKPKLWLHIGTQKTGTTSIQAFMAENRDALSANGVLYPRSLGKLNHISLTAYALDDEKKDSTRILSGVAAAGSTANYRDKLKRDLETECANAGCDTLVFSNEHCSARLRTVREVRRLKMLCDNVASSTKVIVYLRNPVDFFASWYSTTVTGGNTEEFPATVSRELYKLVDYRSLLERWSGVFGRNNVIVRRYAKCDFPNGDLLDDFGGLIGVSHLDLPKPSAKNKSLNMTALLFLREFNKHIPRFANGEINSIRGQIVNALQDFGSEEPFRVPYSEARKIEEDFREDHKFIADKYFNGIYSPLFEPAVSVKDDSRIRHELSVQESIEISAHLWTFMQKRNMSLTKMLNHSKTSAP